MDAKPCRIPIVQIDTVGVHLFFSAEARKAERAGGLSAVRELESTQRHPEKKEKDINSMREVKGNVPSPFSFFFAYSFSSSHSFSEKFCLLCLYSSPTSSSPSHSSDPASHIVS